MSEEIFMSNASAAIRALYLVLLVGSDDSKLIAKFEHAKKTAFAGRFSLRSRVC
jgi:hypothetical protein